MTVHREIARRILHAYRRAIRFFRETGLRLVLGGTGKNLRVFGRVRVDMPQTVFIGNNCSLNEGVLIIGRDEVRIGSNVTISANVLITSAGRDGDGHSKAPVVVKDNVWIAANAVILPGVIIGENSVIAAGAVVTRDVPPNAVAAGIPARVIKQIEPRALAA